LTGSMVISFKDHNQPERTLACVSPATALHRNGQ